MDARRDFASGLIAIGAVKFGEFKLKLHEKNPNAPLSPIYIDLRIIKSFPHVLDAAIRVYKDLIAGLKFDVIADIPTAATPFVAILCHELKVGMISPRKEQKEHGIATKVEGVFQKGNTALLVDDLITQADSKVEAIRVLEEQGLIVKDVVVLIDREQGGIRQLGNAGYTCHAAFKLSELLALLVNEGKISRSDYDRTVHYLRTMKS